MRIHRLRAGGLLALAVILLVVAAVVSMLSRKSQVLFDYDDGDLVYRIDFEPAPQAQPVTINDKQQIQAVIACLTRARQVEDIVSLPATNCRLRLFLKGDRILEYRMTPTSERNAAGGWDYSKDILLEKDSHHRLFLCPDAPFSEILAAKEIANRIMLWDNPTLLR